MDVLFILTILAFLILYNKCVRKDWYELPAITGPSLSERRSTVLATDEETSKLIRC